jgi:hypothetical protein
MSGESVIGPERASVFRAVPGAFPLGAALALAGVLAGSAVLLVGAHRLGFIVCYFKLFTGLPCLTCGGTRAALRLLQADPAAAMAMNPLVAVAGFGLGVWALADLVLLTRRRALRVELGPRAVRVLRVLVPLAVLANWAYLVAVGR